MSTSVTTPVTEPMPDSMVALASNGVTMLPRQVPSSTSALSNEARIWAVKQLARRAGVTRDFFDSWDIEIQPAATIIHVQRDTDKQICFKNLSLNNYDDL